MRNENAYMRTLLLLSSLILGACGVVDIPAAAPTAPSQHIQSTPTMVSTSQMSPESFQMWQHDWLQGTPCAPPCWEGITPGKTTLDEAEAILQTKTFVHKVDLVSSTAPSDPSGSFGWDYVHGKGSGYGSYDKLNPSHVIKHLTINLPGIVPLSAITARYGSPSHVIARASRAVHEPSQISYELRLIFLSQGFSVYRPRLLLTSKMTEDMDVWVLDLFEPTLDGVSFRFRELQANPSALQPWYGFDTFAAYCQPAEEGDLDACAPPSRWPIPLPWLAHGICVAPIAAQPPRAAPHGSAVARTCAAAEPCGAADESAAALPQTRCSVFHANPLCHPRSCATRHAYGTLDHGSAQKRRRGRSHCRGYRRAHPVANRSNTNERIYWSWYRAATPAATPGRHHALAACPQRLRCLRCAASRPNYSHPRSRTGRATRPRYARHRALYDPANTGSGYRLV